MDFSAYWAGALGALGVATIGWFTGGGAWLKARWAGWRASHKERLELDDARRRDHPVIMDTLTELKNIAGRMTGEIRTVTQSVDGLRQEVAETKSVSMAVFEASQTPSFTLDNGGKVLYVNTALTTLLDTGRDELIDYRMRQWMDGAELDRFIRAFERARDEHRDAHIDVAFTLPHGVVRLRIHMVPQPRESKPALHWNCTVEVSP